MLPQPVVSAKCARCPFRVPEICDLREGRLCTTARMLCPSSGPCDEELIARHQEEKASAQPLSSFGELFERHNKHVVAWACRMSGNYELAHDLAQDVFMKVLTRLDDFRAESRFTTWLYTVTRNCYRDYLKARSSRPYEVGDAALQTAAPVTMNDGEIELEMQRTRKLVVKLLRDAKLDRIEIRAAKMHYCEEMSLDQVTTALGLTNASGAKAPIVSARRKLRAAAARWTRQTRTRSAPRPAVSSESVAA